MKLGFFFGAGAELDYGLPGGGKFALDLFRHDVSDEKEELREQLQNNIDRQSLYATQWLPEGFWHKRIHAFGKNEFATLIESSIEYRKLDIIKYLNNIDKAFEDSVKSLGWTTEFVSQTYEESLSKVFGENLYSQVVRMNDLLSQNVEIFDSKFYSALLDFVRSGLAGSEEVQRYAVAFLQLLVGSHGQELVQRLNQEIFVEAPDDIQIFDDVNGMFRLEFSRAGVTALDILLSEKPSHNVDNESYPCKIFSAISHNILEDLFSNILDYQALVDSHFRYLFSPKTEWAKFTKMVIFLKAARKYIKSDLDSLGDVPEEGYYHDLLNYKEGNFEISAVGTANYNSLFEWVADSLGYGNLEVFHLNGGVNDFYNPYKNSIISVETGQEVPQKEVFVPFILTQSGLKPLTSVGMSRRYVDLYDKFSESYAVVVVGYGFNVDDNHINGLFREMVEAEGKHIFWIVPGSPSEEESKKNSLLRKLRLSPSFREYVHVVPVDKTDRSYEGALWLEHVLDVLN